MKILFIYAGACACVILLKVHINVSWVHSNMLLVVIIKSINHVREYNMVEQFVV